jgi:hypothetical protein
MLEHDEAVLQRTIAAVLDHPSVFMGGPSVTNMRKADHLIRAIRNSGYDIRMKDAGGVTLENAKRFYETFFAPVSDLEPKWEETDDSFKERTLEALRAALPTAGVEVTVRHEGFAGDMQAALTPSKTGGRE